MSRLTIKITAMRYRKLCYQLSSLILFSFLLCSCTKVLPVKQHFRHITTDEFMQANIQAQKDQDARIQKKSNELDKLHVTGSERARQLESEKVVAHKAFLDQLNENKKEVIEGITQRPQK